MKRKLTRRETLAHLDAIITAAPADGRADSATFLLRLKALRDVVATEDHDEITLATINSSLFPGLKPESRRSTFSNFRTAIGNAAAAIGHDLALIQPPVRGKSASQISLHFEGRPLPDNRETLTAHATAKLDQLVQTDPRIVPDVIRIFISFANDDAAKAAELKDLLEATWGERRSHRVSFWIFNNPGKGGILAGENNLEEIRKAIASCPLALFLLAPSFTKSKFIREHELPAYFPNQPSRHPVFVNLRNSKPPAAHLPEELLSQFVFSQKEKSYEDMRDRTSREQFAAALNDHIEQLCRKHFGPPGEKTEPTTRPLTDPRRPKDLIPTSALDFCEVAARYHRGDQGVDAVADLLAWAKNPNRAHYFALLGETGAGKSTTALLFARAINEEKNPTRAYLFDLRYANYDGLLDRTNKRPTLDQLIEAILRRHDIHDLKPEDYLRAVREEEAVLIFDGLDEVFVSLNASEQDSLMHQLLRALPIEAARRPGAGKLLFACRTQYFRSNEAERGGLTLHGREGLDFEEGKRASFELARMLPFTEEQIRAYFVANLPAIPFDEIWSLLEKIHELRELATHPYLLDLIRKQIPSLNAKVERNETVRAVDLYDGFISDWSHERNRYHNVLQPEDKNELMERLAVHMWRLETKSLPAREMERWLLDTLVLTPRWQIVYADLLKPQFQESLLSDFRTASFISRWEGDTFRFAHTSLQEYFLARHLAKSLISTALCTSNTSPEQAWDLPMPSMETFDFIGQLLQNATPRERESALASLAALLGDSSTMPDAKLAALRFHLHATAKSLPAPESPDLDCTGLDLEGWKFHGTAEKPLTFGNTILVDANLLRTSFEHVRFQNRADFRSVDLRSSRFFDCPLASADFRGCLMDGDFFRECDLNGVQVDDRCLAARVIAHLCPGSPWPSPPQPALPSAILSPGHASIVSSVGFSLDGALILSVSYDNTFRLWDVASGECIRSFHGEDDSFLSSALSPDRAYIVSGSIYNKIRLWDATSGKCIRSFIQQEHEGLLFCIAFSPDSSSIIAGSRDNTLRLWDVTSGKSIHSFSGHEDYITSVAFSPCGAFIISGSHDKTLRLWEKSTGKCIRSFSGHNEGVASVAYSPDGNLVLSGSSDNTLRLWNAASGKCIRAYTGHERGINSVAFSPDGTSILSGSDDCTLRLWDSASDRCIRFFSGVKEGITSVAFSPDGALILAGSFDNKIRLWDTASGKCLRSITGHEHRITSIALSPTGESILSGFNDNTVRLWDASTGECIRYYSGHGEEITCVTFSPDEKLILSGSWDNTLRLWDATSGKCIQTFTGHEEAIESIAFSPNGELVIGKDYQGETRCWDLHGNPVSVPDDSDKWLESPPTVSAERSVQLIGDSVFCLRKNDSILREILCFPDGPPLIRKPWDEDEARKPYHEIRWKFTRGPKDAWRWCHVVDPETGTIHPPELAAEPGAFSGPGVGPG